MHRRTRAREKAVQSLYRIDISGTTGTENLGPEIEEMRPGTEARRYYENLVRGVIDTEPELDAIIERHSEHWAMSRMTVVDRNVLRIALFELLYCLDTPVNVVIDEAVELAKKFGSEQSGAFINGILDHVVKRTDELKKVRPH